MQGGANPASPTGTSSTDSAPASSSGSSKSSGSTHQISTQGVVAIIVCTTLAITSIVLLLLCILRRKRKRQNSFSNSSTNRTSRIMNELSLPTAADPYQPLMSSHSATTGQPPMTPPPRLRDRRILPLLLRPISRGESLTLGGPFEKNPHHSTGGSSFYSVAQSQDAKQDVASLKTLSVARSSFLASPVCTPTSRKLEPRQEKMPTQQQHSPKTGPTAALLSMMSQSSEGAPQHPQPSSPTSTASFHARLRSPPPVSLPKPLRLNRPQDDHTDDDSSYISAKPGSMTSQRYGHRRGLTTSSTSSRGGGSTSSSRTIPGKVPSLARNTCSSVSTVSSSGEYYGGIGTGVAPRLYLQPNFTATGDGDLFKDQQQQQQDHIELQRPTPSSSPARPQRPHEEPLEIPDLVRPSGWPVPPMGSGAIGIARTTAAATPASQARDEHQHYRLASLVGSIGPGDGEGAGSLQSLAERHRDSWGSWADEVVAGPGRMFGVSFPPAASSRMGKGEEDAQEEGVI